MADWGESHPGEPWSLSPKVWFGAYRCGFGTTSGHQETFTNVKLERFLADPATWPAAHGGRAAAPAF